MEKHDWRAHPSPRDGAAQESPPRSRGARHSLRVAGPQEAKQPGLSNRTKARCHQPSPTKLWFCCQPQKWKETDF